MHRVGPLDSQPLVLLTSATKPHRYTQGCSYSVAFGQVPAESESIGSAGQLARGMWTCRWRQGSAHCNNTSTQ
jgi:hypothetical protein